MSITIKGFLKDTLESVTLDLIPGYITKYYTLNSDHSGFYMLSEHSNILSYERVYYPKDSFTNVEEFKNKYVAHIYKLNLISSIVAWIVAILFLLIPFAGLILAPIALISTQWIVAILLGIKSHKSIMNEITILSVDAGLGKHSNNSDRVFARSQAQNSAKFTKVMNETGNIKDALNHSKQLRQEASEAIRARN